MSVAPGRMRAVDAVLLPAALLLVVLEDVLWRGLLAVLHHIAHVPPVAALARALGRLPGWAALPLFLVPEAVGKLGELWAAALLFGGHAGAAVSVYAGVRLVAAVVAVFIYRACAPALLRIRWFATAAGWVQAARDWAHALLGRLLDRARLLMRSAGLGTSLRFRALRRRLAVLVTGRTPG